jgi:hypothetical protein
LDRESTDYYRARARDEREAALKASCDEARWAHEEMAEAYERLVELRDLEQVGELAPGKVTSMSETLHNRDDAEYGRGHGRAPDGPSIIPKS